MKSPTPSVGDIIDARCTKCLKVTNHVVVAMIGATPAKVQCNTCSGLHRYRNPAPPVRKATKRTGDSPALQAELKRNSK